MKIFAYKDRNGSRQSLGEYPAAPIPTVGSILYLPDGDCVKVKEIRYHYDNGLISVHCDYN
jgi:hypothetical protein